MVTFASAQRAAPGTITVYWGVVWRHAGRPVFRIFVDREQQALWEQRQLRLGRICEDDPRRISAMALPPDMLKQA